MDFLVDLYSLAGRIRIMTKEVKIGEKIAEGDEKLIYEDPNSKEKVIALYKERQLESPNTVKARFYLTKILHLLFPQNIPDIHWSGSDPHGYSTQRVEETRLGRLKNSLRPYYKSKQDKKDEVALTNKFDQLGIGFDHGPLNFMEDLDSKIVYVDSFWPWQVIMGEEKLELNFNIDKLNSAIEDLPEGSRKVAQNHLSRLLELYKKEQDNLFPAHKY